MTYPADSSGGFLLEARTAAVGPNDDGKYRYVSDWQASNDVNRITVAVTTNADEFAVAVEQGIRLDGYSSPESVAWTELPAFETSTALGRYGQKVVVGDVLLAGRYFRLHVHSVSGNNAVTVTVRAIEGNLL